MFARRHSPDIGSRAELQPLRKQLAHHFTQAIAARDLSSQKIRSRFGVRVRQMRGEIVHFDVLPTTNANNFEVVIWSWENGPAGPKNHITVPVTRNAETGRLSANWDRSRLRPLTLDEISNAKATREVIPALPERKGGGNPFGATN